MAKSKSNLFECQSCGQTYTKWVGKCTNCGAWESIVELSNEQQKFKTQIEQKSATSSNRAIPIEQVQELAISRLPSGDAEFDLVLGGGVVPSSLVLIGGAPGVGKSTLMLKIAGNMAKIGAMALYVTGEESAAQVKMRASRLDCLQPTLYLLTEISLEVILAELASRQYDMVVIDSVQTLYSEQIPSASGSVAQVREITFALMRFAKEHGVAVFIIGHITKEGSIAGPRVLEHMVDTVLYFDGEVGSEIRILRGFKNRFGSTAEVGIFEMTKDGLQSAKDVGARFFKRGLGHAGSAVTVLMEGSRPLAVEIQALVSESAYPNPKRSATGFEATRLTMLLALLERKLELPFNRYDVYINVAGGIKVSEPAADLAVIAAIVSSFKNRPIQAETVFVGEVSLIGDIRDASQLELRLNEAAAQGFSKAVIPAKPKNYTGALKCFEATEVAKLLEWM